VSLPAAVVWQATGAAGSAQRLANQATQAQDATEEATDGTSSESSLGSTASTTGPDPTAAFGRTPGLPAIDQAAADQPQGSMPLSAKLATDQDIKTAAAAMNAVAMTAAKMPRAPTGISPAAAAATRAPDTKAPGAAFAASTRSGGDESTDVAAADGSGYFAVTSADSSASAQSPNAAAIDMALTEGSDATGAAASAVQAADSATAAPVNAGQGLVGQGLMGQGLLAQGVAGASASPSSVSQVTATLAVADASALGSANDGDKHAHGGAGDAASSGNGGDGAAAAQQLSSTVPSAESTDASPTPTFRVNDSVDSANFPDGLADRVSWMVGNNLNGARLQVNPPQLGPIELQIAVQGNHAQVSMSTHSAVTREALESSLPKLREMLSAQGFGQVSVDISQRSFQERSAYSQPYEWSPPASRTAAPVSPTSNAMPRTSLGVVDAYA